MTQEVEEWKAIPGYEDYYEVSTHGNIRSVDRCVPTGEKGIRFLEGCPLTQSTYGRYNQIRLTKNSEKKTLLVHRLVALAFLPNPENLPEVDHIDRNKRNNHLSNLRWVSRSTNGRNTNVRKTNKLGEKNIHFDEHARKFRVKISYLNVLKRFSKLEDAIKYRDEKLAESRAV